MQSSRLRVSAVIGAPYPKRYLTISNSGAILTLGMPMPGSDVKIGPSLNDSPAMSQKQDVARDSQAPQQAAIALQQSYTSRAWQRIRARSRAD